MVFRDRREAGKQLSERLLHLRGHSPIVLALPRGGVVVGDEVARALGAPLEVIVARKLGAPGNPEFGFGAIGPGGERVLDRNTVRMLGLSEADIELVAREELEELQRRLHHYRGDRPMPELRGRTAIVVDDGLATGVTARAALRAVRRMQPARLVLAVPVSPPDTAESMAAEVDELVCLHTPPGFMAVGQWYQVFDQTSDEEVMQILERHRGEERPVSGEPPSPRPRTPGQ
jgi:predicted phosphoribosyltransferase